MTLFVLENAEPTNTRQLTSLFGTQYRATPVAWVSILVFLVLGIVLSFIFAPVVSIAAKVIVGLFYGLLATAASFLHGVGHILSARMVNAPMDYLIATATVHITIYDDKEAYPPRVHIGRALGGPAFNALVGVVALLVYWFVIGNHFIAFFGGINLFFAMFTIMPIPSLDGAVVLRELAS